MDPKQFRKSQRDFLVRVEQNDPPYWAFVPPPLPPRLREDKLWLVLSDASHALGRLEGLGPSMPNPQLFIQPLLRREAVLSSRIEGTLTEITDLYVYEAGQLPLAELGPAPGEADVREVLNYVRALQHGLDRVTTLPIGRRLMCELHDILLQGVRGQRFRPGEFRRDQNWIGRRGDSVYEAQFVPPPVTQMEEALDALENYIHAKDDTPPLVRLALIHYQFEAIHPFLDGNGRIGRLLIALLLVDWDLLSLPLLYLSPYFEKNRDKYVNLLQAVSERGAWEEWVVFFLHGVTEQSRDTGERVRRLRQLRVEWRDQLQQERLTGSILWVTDLLFERPIVTARGIQERMGVSHQAAMRTLRRLEDMGILSEVTGGERNLVYMARAILDVLV